MKTFTHATNQTDTYTISRLGKNQRLLTVSSPIHSNCYTILISYDVPVAVRYNNGWGERSMTRWSRTTESHLRDFAKGNSPAYSWFGQLEQESLDSLLQDTIGDVRLLETRDTSREAPRTNTRYVTYSDHTEQGDKNLVVAVNRRPRYR